MSKLPKFRAGDEIEITSRDLCMHGTLFPCKVIGQARDKANLVVEYTTFNSKNSSEPLIDEVDRRHARPKQPEEHGKEFKIGDVVDAFYKGGWREGVIDEVSEGGSGRFGVRLRFSEEVHEFGGSDVRAHRVWSNGSWDPPLDEDCLSNSIPIKKEMFNIGELVEIRNDEEGFKGAWFTATIVNPEEEDNFLVEYKHLLNDENTESLKEVVDAKHMRPFPPELVLVDGYSRNEKVDALYNDGWWEGKICKVLSKARYKVYFEGTNDEMVFRFRDLRPHQDWINDTWVTASDD